MKYRGWLFQLSVAQCRGPGSSLSKGGKISAASFTVHLVFPQSALSEFVSLSCQYLTICCNNSLLQWAWPSEAVLWTLAPVCHTGSELVNHVPVLAGGGVFLTCSWRCRWLGKALGAEVVALVAPRLLQCNTIAWFCTLIPCSGAEGSSPSLE